MTDPPDCGRNRWGRRARAEHHRGKQTQTVGNGGSRVCLSGRFECRAELGPGTAHGSGDEAALVSVVVVLAGRA